MGQAEKKCGQLKRTWGRGKDRGRQVKRRREGAERTWEEGTGRETRGGQEDAGMGVARQGGCQPQAHLRGAGGSLGMADMAIPPFPFLCRGSEASLAEKE